MNYYYSAFHPINYYKCFSTIVKYSPYPNQTLVLIKNFFKQMEPLKLPGDPDHQWLSSSAARYGEIGDF